MKKKKDFIEKINPLIMLFDSILIVSMGVTSLISLLIVMKCINEVWALSYISNINLFKHSIKIIGYLSLGLITAVTSNIWWKKNILDTDRDFQNTKLGWFAFILFIIIIYFMGWSVKIFIETIIFN